MGTGAPIVAPQVKNPMESPWGHGFNPRPCSVGQESSVATSCGVGCRCSSDLMLLWLCLRLAAAAPIWPLPGNFYMLQVRPLKKRKKEKRKRNGHEATQSVIICYKVIANFVLLVKLGQWKIAADWSESRRKRLRYLFSLPASSQLTLYQLLPTTSLYLQSSQGPSNCSFCVPMSLSLVKPPGLAS